MISNIKSCCRQCLNPNQKFYVEIRNETSEFLNATLYYSVFGKDITKPTPPFGPNKNQRIVFPDNALAIFFQVFRTSIKPLPVVCTRQIPNYMISVFKVIELQSGKLTCIKV